MVNFQTYYPVQNLPALNSGLQRFLPEPRSSAALNFASVLAGAGALLGNTTAGFTGIQAPYLELLMKQIEMQSQMQLVSLYSNIEKSRHETQMAAVRNIRVG